MTPSFFSWLGNGTSRRGFPVTLSGGPSSSVGCIAVEGAAVAGFEDDDDMRAD